MLSLNEPKITPLRVQMMSCATHSRCVRAFGHAAELVHAFDERHAAQRTGYDHWRMKNRVA
jgi:hypothetical protein